MTADGTIAADDPRAPEVRELLAAHLAFAGEHTEPENIYALDLSGLLDPAIEFFSYRVNGRLLAVGALKRLDAGHGELKSMHTNEAARGQGIGRAMLQHLIGIARDRGFRRLSLETGSSTGFAAARALYESAGFEPSAAFADYPPSPTSTFMTLLL